MVLGLGRGHSATHFQALLLLLYEKSPDLTREVHELRGVVTTLQIKLEEVAPTVLTNQTRLDPSDLRLRLTSRSDYSRRHKSETDPSYQPEQEIGKHVTRNGSCFRREMSKRTARIHPVSRVEKSEIDAARTKGTVPKDELMPSNERCVPKGELRTRPPLCPVQRNLLPQGKTLDTPCPKQLRKAKIPPNFWMPQCDLYDGSGDPGEHVYQFQTNMLLLQVSDAVMCRSFPTTLRKAAHAWFKSLRPRSIHSFTQLSNLFQKHFVSSRTRRKNSASFLNVVQERNKSLSRYLGRFNAATLEIDNLDESVKYTAFMRGLCPTSNK
ncbi:hypothetical protein RJ639_016068 [Escallonia herrerae]|uniref:Retrotransposon gag domain-containing protein n=1 Tax=Escallonia herrerae TaxID=1293975 RepID=A0AA88VC55_9ASTE|nr:hypothetical protein RJ639_016068 [Escallonia herrerae]